MMSKKDNAKEEAKEVLNAMLKKRQEGKQSPPPPKEPKPGAEATPPLPNTPKPQQPTLHNEGKTLCIETADNKITEALNDSEKKSKIISSVIQYCQAYTSELSQNIEWLKKNENLLLDQPHTHELKLANDRNIDKEKTLAVNTIMQSIAPRAIEDDPHDLISLENPQITHKVLKMYMESLAEEYESKIKLASVKTLENDETVKQAFSTLLEQKKWHEILSTQHSHLKDKTWDEMQLAQGLCHRYLEALENGSDAPNLLLDQNDIKKLKSGYLMRNKFMPYLPKNPADEIQAKSETLYDFDKRLDENDIKQLRNNLMPYLPKNPGNEIQAKHAFEILYAFDKRLKELTESKDSTMEAAQIQNKETSQPLEIMQAQGAANIDALVSDPKHEEKFNKLAEIANVKGP